MSALYQLEVRTGLISRMLQPALYTRAESVEKISKSEDLLSQRWLHHQCCYTCRVLRALSCLNPALWVLMLYSSPECLKTAKWQCRRLLRIVALCAALVRRRNTAMCTEFKLTVIVPVTPQEWLQLQAVVARASSKLFAIDCSTLKFGSQPVHQSGHNALSAVLGQNGRATAVLQEATVAGAAPQRLFT